MSLRAKALEMFLLIPMIQLYDTDIMLGSFEVENQKPYSLPREILFQESDTNNNDQQSVSLKVDWLEDFKDFRDLPEKECFCKKSIDFDDLAGDRFNGYLE